MEKITLTLPASRTLSGKALAGVVGRCRDAKKDIPCSVETEHDSTLLKSFGNLLRRILARPWCLVLIRRREEEG